MELSKNIIYQIRKELESKIDKPILRDLIRIITILIEIKEYNLARKLIEESEYKNPQIVFFSGVLHDLKKEYPEAKARFKMLSPISFIILSILSCPISLFSHALTIPM